MATEAELNEIIRDLRGKLYRAQTFMHQQRHTLKKVRRTRLAAVAGPAVEDIDLSREAEKVVEFTQNPIEEFEALIDVLRFYGNPDNYIGGAQSPIASDIGAKARNAMRKLV